jgi:hypothetical protein
MKKLLRILTVHSVKDLLRYKSFFLLIFLLLLADRIIHRFVKTPDKNFVLPHGMAFSHQTADYLFGQLPQKLVQWLFTPRIIAIAAGLFLLKQVISLWPSSDMRRMHRKERGRFGVFEALLALRWYQMAWDGLAVGTLCAVLGVWLVLAFLLGLSFWAHALAVPGLLSAAGMALSALPLAMAGFSYSSKLAVIRNGTFGARLKLFLYLFVRWRVLWMSWLFFAVRIVVEAIFVAIIPAGALLFIDSFWLRMLIATVSATPVYSYLKMASFKFFLEVYGEYALVRTEYSDYYDHRSDYTT